MSMKEHYSARYYYADRFGGLIYKDPSGAIREFGYYAGGLWDFQGILNKLVELLGKPRSVLDIGAGCGGFVAACKVNGIESYGLEFSDGAVKMPIKGSEGILKQWDLENIPWPVDHQYEWVTAIDLFEHLLEDKVDSIIAEAKRLASKYIIMKICTAQKPSEVWSAKRASYDEIIRQAKKEGFEWLVVSGHVNSNYPKYWLDKFEDSDWRNREDLAEALKRDLKLPEDWRCTIILEKK